MNRSTSFKNYRVGGNASALAWILAVALALVSFSAAGNFVVVSDANGLRDALRAAQGGDTIEILPGDYLLSNNILNTTGPDLTPIVVRASMPGTVRLWSTAEVLFEIQGGAWQFNGLDFQGSSSASHAIYLNGGGSFSHIEGNRFQNFHAAIRAGSRNHPPEFADKVRILRNVFANDTLRNTRLSVTAIDAVGGKDWEITENFFADIALTPRSSGRPSAAAVVRGGAYGAVLDRNLVMCEWRHSGGQRMGLSLGGEGTSNGRLDSREMAGCGDACPETQFSRVTNNVILNCPDEPGIYLNKASRALVANNTVFNAFGIQARYPETEVKITDNLVSGTIAMRDEAHAEMLGNIETGWFDVASRLAGVKRMLTLPFPERRILQYEWLDHLIRGSVSGVHSSLDFLANSFLGKGLGTFDRWFMYPQAGDFRLASGDEVLVAGSFEPSVSYDFCNHQRSSPSNTGAFDYHAGSCELSVEIERRHGSLLTTLMESGSQPPPDWRRSVARQDLAAPLPTPKRVLDANPDTYRKVVAGLQPGDWLRLAPGEYTRPLSLHRLEGTAEDPIVISGPINGKPALFLGRSGVNTVSLIDSAHLVIQHLTLDGRGQDIAGVVAEGHGTFTHDITIDNLTIRNFGGSQANSGITTRVTSWNWVIRNNDIRNVGTGMYLGKPNGQGPFIGGVIENNFISDTVGYNVQIKQQNVRDRLPHMPTEPRQTFIRHNVFSKATGGSDGDRARPNLLVGHLPPSGPGQHDRILIYGNLFHENPHERLFQGEGNLAIYNNLFINRKGDGLILRRHNDAPKNIHILQNTVVVEGVGIAIVHPDPDFEQIVAGNAIFATEPLQLPRRIDGRANFTADRAMAESLLVNPDAQLARLNLAPRGQELRHNEILPVIDDLPHLDRDYNERSRQNAIWGAYGSESLINVGREAGIGPRAANCAPCQ